MANIRRKLGVNISVFLQKSEMTRENLAEKMGYTNRDMSRVLEGRLILPPREIEKLAGILDTTMGELMNYEADVLVPELQYMKKFENPENLDKVLDLIDEYIELKEAM